MAVAYDWLDTVLAIWNESIGIVIKKLPDYR
jgi:hypothetical protein